MLHRLLPIVVIITVFATILVTPLKRQVLYTLQEKSAQKIKLVDDVPSCRGPQSLTEETGAFDDSASLAFFDGQVVDYPKTSLAEINDKTLTGDVLSAYNSNGQEKWIEIELQSQKLRAWEGNQIVREFPISSGLWYPTPPGTYEIYWKLRYTRMKGGSKDLGTFYDLPNVPDTMYFYKGYGIHGAYWHNNFGHPMSHGCVNEPLDQAHWLFEWAGPNINSDQNTVRSTPENPGSRVFIH